MADIARHVIQRILNPRLWSQIAPYDVAINIVLAPRHPMCCALNLRLSSLNNTL